MRVFAAFLAALFLGCSQPREDCVGELTTVLPLRVQIGNRLLSQFTSPWDPWPNEDLWEIVTEDQVTVTSRNGYLFMEHDGSAPTSSAGRLFVSNWWNDPEPKELFTLEDSELYFKWRPARRFDTGATVYSSFRMIDWYSPGYEPHVLLELVPGIFETYPHIDVELGWFGDTTDNYNDPFYLSDGEEWWVRVRHDSVAEKVYVEYAVSGCDTWTEVLSKDWVFFDALGEPANALDKLSLDVRMDLPPADAQVAGTFVQRSSTGLLRRYEYDNGSFPWATSDWDIGGSDSISLSGGALVWDPPASDSHFIRDNTVASRTKVFVQEVSALGSTITSKWMGPSVHNSFSTLETGVAFQMSVNRTFGDGIDHTQIRETEALAATSTSTQSDPPRKNEGQYYRSSVYADGNSIVGYDFDDALEHTHTTTNLNSGGVGMWHINGHPKTTRYRWTMTDRYVTVSGLTTGQIAKVRQSDDTVIDSAAESGGVATLDLFLAHFEGATKPTNIAVFESDGTTLVAEADPTGGVWGGDTFAVATYDGTEPVAGFFGPFNPPPVTATLPLLVEIGDPKVPGLTKSLPLKVEVGGS